MLGIGIILGQTFLKTANHTHGKTERELRSQRDQHNPQLQPACWQYRMHGWMPSNIMHGCRNWGARGHMPLLFTNLYVKCLFQLIWRPFWYARVPPTARAPDSTCPHFFNAYYVPDLVYNKETSHQVGMLSQKHFEELHYPCTGDDPGGGGHAPKRQCFL